MGLISPTESGQVSEYHKKLYELMPSRMLAKIEAQGCQTKFTDQFVDMIIVPSSQ